MDQFQKIILLRSIQDNTISMADLLRKITTSDKEDLIDIKNTIIKYKANPCCGILASTINWHEMKI